MTRRWLLPAALTLASLLASASPALADVKNPSTCDTWATTQHWTNQCYVANDAANCERTGHYSSGAQWILKGAGLYTGAIDGIFGAGSATAMTNYQNNRGLFADGRVTANDWTDFKQNRMPFLTTQNGYDYFKVVGISGPTPFARNSTNYDWFVLLNSQAAYTQMDTNL